MCSRVTSEVRQQEEVKDQARQPVTPERVLCGEGSSLLPCSPKSLLVSLGDLDCCGKGPH